MVSSEKKLANAMGGKTERACDSCVTKRARWYCAADDAFLCQFCDTLVHSANPLARGHERVRLKVASIKLSSLEIPSPSWHQGFMKKSRTPRSKNSNKLVCHPTSKSNENLNFNPLHLVPEIESDQLDTKDLDEQLPYQVPVFDPFSGDDELEDPFHLHGLNGFVLPTDLELAKFADDVESLLGKSLDERSFAIESLGMVDFRLNDLVKVEEEAQFEAWEEEDEKVKNEDEKCEIVFDDHVNIHIENYENIHNTNNKTMKMLKLDYEGIIAAWDDDRSPWTTGDRPELVPDDCWPECMGGCGKMQHYHCGDMGMMTGNPSRLDGGREARVSRYKKKRLTRLFSKKIRYEVRKLNAEKRPRMKGRFVKRTSFVT